MLFRTWEALPATGPVAGVVPVDGHWVVAEHALVRQVLADPDTYRPDNALDAATPIPVAAMRVLTRHGFRLPATLANNGTPSHPGLRAVAAEALHPDRVEAQRPWLTGVVRRRVIRLARAVRAGDVVDLHAEISRDLPLLVLGRLVALPEEDLALVKRFSAAALELFWAPLHPDRQLELAELVGEFHARLRRFVRTAPGLVGQLREYAAGAGLGEDEVVGVLFFLLVAGQETTSQFLTLLLHRLIAEPSVLAGVTCGNTDVADVVEEGLRLEPPIVTWRRVTAREVDLGGTRLPPGASVVLWLAAAGRDPAVVAEPDRYVPGQSGARRHLAFGAGAHRCLGAQLSRMEAWVVVAELSALLRRCQVIKAPWSPDNLSFRMPDALLVAAAS